MSRTTHELTLIAAALARAAARVYDAYDEADLTGRGDVTEGPMRDQYALLEGLDEEDLKMVAILTASHVALIAGTLSEAIDLPAEELLDGMIHAAVDQAADEGDQT